MGREGRELLMSIFDGLGFEDLNKEQCDPRNALGNNPPSFATQNRVHLGSSRPRRGSVQNCSQEVGIRVHYSFPIICFHVKEVPSPTEPVLTLRD